MKRRSSGALAAGRSILVALLLVSMGLAGCLGTDDQANDAPAAPTEDEELESAKNESTASPENESTAGSDEERASGDEAPELVRETRELTWDGYMPEQVIACTPGPCAYQDGPLPVSDQRDNTHEIGTTPMPVAAEFTLTWDNPEASGHEMLFGIVTDACEDGCQEIIWKEGTSGVTISVDDVNLDEDDGFAVTVHHTYEYYPGGVYYSTGPPVDFTVQGTYEVLVPSE